MTVLSIIKSAENVNFYLSLEGIASTSLKAPMACQLAILL